MGGLGLQDPGAQPLWWPHCFTSALHLEKVTTVTCPPLFRDGEEQLESCKFSFRFTMGPASQRRASYMLHAHKIIRRFKLTSVATETQVRCVGKPGETGETGPMRMLTWATAPPGSITWPASLP